MKGINLVPFENVTINDGDAFNLQTHKFVTPYNGFYWIHFSVSIPADTWANVHLLGYFKPLDIIRQHTNFTGKSMTTSRDGILLLQSATALWLSSDYALYSDPFLQTSFSGFSLTSTMNPLTVFSVARSTSLLSRTNDKINYDIVNIDTTNAWDSVNNEYIVPLNGTFIISLSTGAYPKELHIVGIHVNNVHLASNIFFDTSHIGIDIISRTIITNLNVGDRLYTQCHEKHCSLYSSIDHQLTTLLGFLYSPYRSVPISWWVGKGKDGFKYGEAYPLVFDDMLINQGNGWNETTNIYLVPLAGVYYIHLTTGVVNSQSKLELMRNGLSVMNVQLETNKISNFVSSRAIILSLKKYEQLCIRQPFGYRVKPNDHKQVSFAGFRIYA